MYLKPIAQGPIVSQVNHFFRFISVAFYFAILVVVLFEFLLLCTQTCRLLVYYVDQKKKKSLKWNSNLRHFIVCDSCQKNTRWSGSNSMPIKDLCSKRSWYAMIPKHTGFTVRDTKVDLASVTSEKLCVSEGWPERWLHSWFTSCTGYQWLFLTCAQVVNPAALRMCIHAVIG